ncbi:MAG: hypothetical protein IKP99_05005 [Bacteroidales bacterium]|nr:hypothetical protein [Bacteroidales bacterium]
MKELDLKKRSEQLKCKIAQILNVSSDFDAIEDKKLRVVAQDLYRHCVDETTLVALDDEDVIDFATDKYGWHAFSPFINVYQGTLDSISGQMIGIPPGAYEVSVDEMQMNEIPTGDKVILVVNYKTKPRDYELEGLIKRCRGQNPDAVVIWSCTYDENLCENTYRVDVLIKKEYNFNSMDDVCRFVESVKNLPLIEQEEILNTALDVFDRESEDLGFDVNDSLKKMLSPIQYKVFSDYREYSRDIFVDAMCEIINKKNEKDGE